MSKSVLDATALRTEAAAYAWVEARVWPDGPICPHCGGVERIGKMGGKSTRIGVYKCYQCRKQFTVKVGTVFEDSHIPMHLWLQAMHLLCASKKGISSNQLHRILGVTLKTAWFMSHRIREAMRTVGVEPMGGAGEVVEIDETFFGRVKGEPKRRGTGHKHVVLSLIHRGGSSRSFHVGGKPCLSSRPDSSWVREVQYRLPVPSLYEGERRALNGRRLYKCNACGSLEPWSTGHTWYGSIRDLEDSGKVVISCSDQCRTELVAIGLVPKDAKYIERGFNHV